MEYSFSSTRAADEDLEAFLNENVVLLPNGDYLISTLNAECTINNDDETNPDTRVSSAAKRMAANVRSNILRDNVASLKISTFSILGRSIVRACRDHEKDLIILAYPSSGKSTMVAMSIIEEVVFDFHSDEWVFEHNASCTQITPLIVHLLPTKEGVDQITGLYEAIRKRTGLKIAKCYGGGNRDDNDDQLDSLQHADVIVATPGRIYDLFENGYISFKCFRYICVDEADKLLLSERKASQQPNDPACHIRSQMWNHTSNIFTTVPKKHDQPALENASNANEIKRIFLTSYMNDK